MGKYKLFQNGLILETQYFTIIIQFTMIIKHIHPVLRKHDYTVITLFDFILVDLCKTT